MKYIDKKQVDLYSVENREKRGGKMKKTEIKTNAMRILERNKVPYEAIQYECEEFIDGLHTAQITGCLLYTSCWFFYREQRQFHPQWRHRHRSVLPEYKGFLLP